MSFQSIQETSVQGPRLSSLQIKVGDKFCWINPKILPCREARVTEWMIEQHGHGPFVLEEIQQTPLRTMFVFTDGNGEKVQVTKEYFTTYED